MNVGANAHRGRGQKMKDKAVTLEFVWWVADGTELEPKSSTAKRWDEEKAALLGIHRLAAREGQRG